MDTYFEVRVKLKWNEIYKTITLGDITFSENIPVTLCWFMIQVPIFKVFCQSQKWFTGTADSLFYMHEYKKFSDFAILFQRTLRIKTAKLLFG